MTARAELQLQATMENLGTMLAWVDGWCAEHRLPTATFHEIRLAAEEICTNVIVHGYAGTAAGPLRMELEEVPGRIVLTVEDEAPPFDPTSAAPPDLGAAWQDRQLGGLGWYLVRQMADELHHETSGTRGNRITLVKRIPPAPSLIEEEKHHGSTR
jgi:serine/threonine-protein kinase RsbW